jgi:hypothetical protein
MLPVHIVGSFLISRDTARAKHSQMLSFVTPAWETVKNKLGLFDDSKLPDSLRAALLSVADELWVNSLEETLNDSPEKKLLLTRVAFVEEKLNCTCSPQKKHLIGELAKKHCIAKKETEGPGLAVAASNQKVRTVVDHRAPAASYKTHLARDGGGCQQATPISMGGSSCCVST